jgi:hypothetical protein
MGLGGISSPVLSSFFLYVATRLVLRVLHPLGREYSLAHNAHISTGFCSPISVEATDIFRSGVVVAGWLAGEMIVTAKEVLSLCWLVGLPNTVLSEVKTTSLYSLLLSVDLQFMYRAAEAMRKNHVVVGNLYGIAAMF